MTSARSFRSAVLLTSLVAFAGWSGTIAAQAQSHAIVLAQQDGDQDSDQPAPQPQGQDFGNDQNAADPSSMLLRVGRLENEIRTLRGRVEELQHQNDQLQDNLRKLSQDVDFRFQDLQHGGASGAVPPRQATPQRHGEADPGVAAPAAPAVAVATANDGTQANGGYVPLKPTRSGDAFDPSVDPGAPGAPKPLGTTPPSQPLGVNDTARASRSSGNAPLDLTHAHGSDTTADDGTPAVIDAPPAARAMTGQNSVASLAPGGTREEFDADLSFYKQGQYDAAASGLLTFVQKYPRDKLVPDAVYLAGESYSKLGRHREAAEQFLKLSTDYAKSPRAPDALLRLGMSLDALGAKEQACATFEEVTRKYPAASADVKSNVDRELKRARCHADG